MESFWTPGGMVGCEVAQDGVVIAHSGDFMRGWGIETGAQRVEMKPVLELMNEAQQRVHPRLSTALEVFRGIAMAATRVHPANLRLLYGAVKDAIRSSSRTTRMVRVLELNALVSAIAQKGHLRPSHIKRTLILSGTGKRYIGQLTEDELEVAIENATEYLAR